MNAKEAIALLGQMVESNNTFLSKYVKDLVVDKILVEKCMTQSTDSDHIRDFIDWVPLSKALLNDDEYLLHPTLRTERWYYTRALVLAPYLQFFHAAFLDYSEKELENAKNSTRWMKQQEVITTCFNLWSSHKKSKSSLDLYECLLLVTAALEQALGNLFHYVSKMKVPSLLRDLLGLEELALLVGEPQMVTLQLLIGSPLAFNMRNLAWHGFLASEEINAAYVSSLLLICASIGQKLLETTNEDVRSYLSDSSLLSRPWVSFPQTQFLIGIFPIRMADDLGEWESISLVVRQSPVIPNAMKSIWMRAVEHYRQGNHGRCCALLAPLMELLLRLMFCAANRCPERILTAESTTLYTTLDVILAENCIVEEEESHCKKQNQNRISELLGDSLYWALCDVFILPEGPRVRDRLSHAECRLTDIDIVLSNHLLSLSIALLLLPLDHGSSFTMQSAIMQQERLKLTTDVFPQFHPGSIFKRELISALSAVDIWIKDPETVPKEDGEYWTLISTSCTENPDFHDRLLRLLHSFQLPDHLTLILNKWLHWPLSGFANQTVGQEMITCFEQQPTHSWRAIKDNLTLHRHIVRGVRKAVEIISTSVKSYRSQQLSASNFRARRRSTFARLLKYCPLYLMAIQLALIYPMACVMGNQNGNLSAPRVEDKLERNAANFTDKVVSLGQKNRWLELAQSAHHFVSQHSLGDGFPEQLS